MASKRGPDSESDPNTVGAHAKGAVLSYGSGHSRASERAWAAAQAQSGNANIPDRVSNTIPSHRRVGLRQEVEVDQQDQPLLQGVEMGGGTGPTGAGAS